MNAPGRDLPVEVIDSLLLDTSPYLSCDDCFAQLDEYIERLVADADYHDLAMETHLAACKACGEEAEALFELVSMSTDAMK